MNMIVSRASWRVVYGCLLIAGLCLGTAGYAIHQLQKADDRLSASDRDKARAIADNHALLLRLQEQGQRLVTADAEAQRRDRAQQRFAQALARQVHDLGGTPLPAPPGLQVFPGATPSSDEPGSRPTAVPQPSPTPGRTASPRPTRSQPPSSPTPSPTARCSLATPLKCIG